MHNGGSINSGVGGRAAAAGSRKGECWSARAGNGSSAFKCCPVQTDRCCRACSLTGNHNHTVEQRLVLRPGLPVPRTHCRAKLIHDRGAVRPGHGRVT